MFCKPEAAATETDLPKRLNDSSSCEISKKIEVGCMRNEERMDRATAKRRLNFVKGSLDPTTQYPGQIVMHRIYGSIMDMFVSGRKDHAQLYTKMLDNFSMVGMALFWVKLQEKRLRCSAWPPPMHKLLTPGRCLLPLRLHRGCETLTG